MATNLGTLVREIGARFNGMFTITGTTLGTATTVISTGFTKYFPQDVQNLNVWVYCIVPSVGPAPNNAGQEVRGASLVAASGTLTLHAPGFTAVTALSDSYEVHRRLPRSRLVAALNDGIGQLGMYWGREAIDTSLTTAESTWSYTLPAAQNWERVTRVEIQMDTAHTDYPYADARSWNWTARKLISSTTGAEAWTLQFGLQPPPGRLLRVYGEGYYSSLAADVDVLPLSGTWQGMALSWLYDWAMFRLWDETANAFPTGDAEKARQRSLDKLSTQKDFLLTRMKSHSGGRIIVPGQGDGQFRQSGRDQWMWLGSLANQH